MQPTDYCLQEGGHPWKAHMPRILKFIYYILIVSAFCANMLVVSHTTILSVLGAGLALRGPDGSMMIATDGLYEERIIVFQTFGVGLACTVSSVVVCVWLHLHWESAVVCFFVAIFTCRAIWINYRRVYRRFEFDERDTVDFRDIMEGPANIQAMPSALARNGGIGGFYSSYTQQKAELAAAKAAVKLQKPKNNSTSLQRDNHHHRQQQRRPSPSGTASYSSVSYSHKSSKHRQAEKEPSSYGGGFRGLHKRMTSRSSMDEQDVDTSHENANSGEEGDDTSLSSTSDAEIGRHGTGGEVELQALIERGADAKGKIKRRTNTQSTTHATNASSHKQKKKGDYHIQTV
jgi:hypothetical protein